jgi:chromosome segregation ATPase
MPRVRSLLLAAVPAALVGAIAAGLWIRHTGPEAQRAGQFAQLENANSELRARITQLEQESSELRQKLAEQGIVVAPRASAPDRPRPEVSPGQLEAVRALTQVQAKLTAANGAIAELQNRTHEFEATIARLTDENKRFESETAELKESLASTNRIVSAMEVELKSKTERLVQMEAAVRKARDDTAGSAQKLSQAAATAKELEDINRRRENTLTSLQRRYRDLTDQFRAFALRLDTNRDNPTTLTPDLSRIQSNVQSADEELRQLVGLNTQAQRIAQKISAR